MHELGLAEGILAVALDVAAGERVERVRVSVGALQRVVPDSLQFCFELAARDTHASTAVIEIEETPTRLRCRACRTERTVESEALACSACEAFDVELLAGDGVSVDAVKVAGEWRVRPDARRAVVETS